MREYQFVSWWPDWHGFHFLKPDPKGGWARIYEWFLYLGWWEIRKWKRLDEKDWKVRNEGNQ